MPLPNTRKMLGMIGKPKVPFAMKDTDGDGVVNIMDCKPYDRNKQGLVHRAARSAARFIPGKKLREDTISSIGHREQVAEARKKARRETEIEAVAETETFRIQSREKRKREYIKGGGFTGAISRGITSTGKGITGTAKALSKLPPPQTSRVVKATTKKGKGKKGKRKVRATVRSEPAIPRQTDFKLNI